MYDAEKFDPNSIDFDDTENREVFRNQSFKSSKTVIFFLQDLLKQNFQNGQTIVCISFFFDFRYL